MDETATAVDESLFPPDKIPTRRKRPPQGQVQLHTLLTIRATTAPAALVQLGADEATANQLARLYRDLQTAAAAGPSDALARAKADFLAQLRAFRSAVE